MQPAKVSRVTVLEGQDKHLEVIVDDSQLSLAIGKKGQNVRLAAKLLGWKIDIKSEEEKRQEVEEQMSQVMGQPTTPLESVPDLEPGIVEKLVAAGITTVEQVADMTPEQLEEIPGIGPKTVEKISIAVNNYFSSLDAAAAPRLKKRRPRATKDQSLATRLWSQEKKRSPSTKLSLSKKAQLPTKKLRRRPSGEEIPAEADVRGRRPRRVVHRARGFRRVGGRVG